MIGTPIHGQVVYACKVCRSTITVELPQGVKKHTIYPAILCPRCQKDLAKIVTKRIDVLAPCDYDTSKLEEYSTNAADHHDKRSD